MRTHISDKKNRNRENEEELIAEYSKRDFKQALKECIVERKSDKKEVVEN